jgi:hypothetical protein
MNCTQTEVKNVYEGLGLLISWNTQRVVAKTDMHQSLISQSCYISTDG